MCNWILYLWSLQETDYSTSLQLLHASLGLKTVVKELKQESFLNEIRLKLERRVALKAQVF